MNKTPTVNNNPSPPIATTKKTLYIEMLLWVFILCNS